MTKLKKEFVYNYNGKNWVILDDFMALKEKLKKTQKEYAKTRGQLKEANHILKDVFISDAYYKSKQVQYLKKWGIK